MYKYDNLLLIYILILNYYKNCYSWNNITSLQELSINTSSISITSFHFNPSHQVFDWVDRIFGSNSVFYPEREIKSILTSKPLNDEDIKIAKEKALTKIEVPNYAFLPYCSIELLGFTKLKTEYPFKGNERKKYPSFGKSILTLSIFDHKFTCYYRALYENWRLETESTNPNYWATIFYCIAPNMLACNLMNDHVIENNNTPIQFKLYMKVQSSIWKNSFDAKLYQFAQYKHNKSILPDNIKSHFINQLYFDDNEDNSNKLDIAVCLAIPYTSVDKEKSIANGAMLFEWIRYYSKLGFKIFIYDRDGSNYNYIYKSKYIQSTETIEQIMNNVKYYSYTIRGLLDPSTKGLQYDNTEPLGSHPNDNQSQSRKKRFESQGHDKTQTLTQCRFEAKSVYGYDNIIVADYDEFLYCPAALSSSANNQSKFIENFVRRHRTLGYHQITFPQRLVANTTESTRDCIVLQNNLNLSIFDCFGSYEYYIGAHSIKSIHLGHVCPLTGYHQSCPSTDVPRTYDCLCQNKNIKSNAWRPFNPSLVDRECSFVHLSTNKANYLKYSFNNEDTMKIKSTHNELYEVISS